MTARYEQLEPVTLNMLSATAVTSSYRNAKTIHRIVLAATVNSRVQLLRVVKQVCALFKVKQKRPHIVRSFLFGKNS